MPMTTRAREPTTLIGNPAVDARSQRWARDFSLTKADRTELHLREQRGTHDRDRPKRETL